MSVEHAAQSASVAVLAAGGAGYQWAVSMGVSTSVALPVVLLAVLGAAMAVNNEDRPDWSARVIFSLITSFLASLAIGVYGGPFAAGLVLAGAAKYLDWQGPATGLDPLGSLVLALVGQKYGLKFLLRWVERKAEGG